MEHLEIILSGGQVCLVDKEDFEALSKSKWFANNQHGTLYVKRTTDGMPIHRVILGAQKGQCVDHRNHNGLDNRRSNLRLATKAQNNANKRKSSTKFSSPFKGVGWSKQAKKWKVKIKDRGKLVHLGYFDDEIQAALAYDEKARIIFGDFAHLNFGDTK